MATAASYSADLDVRLDGFSRRPDGCDHSGDRSGRSGGGAAQVTVGSIKSARFSPLILMGIDSPQRPGAQVWSHQHEPQTPLSLARRRYRLSHSVALRRRRGKYPSSSLHCKALALRYAQSPKKHSTTARRHLASRLRPSSLANKALTRAITRTLPRASHQ